MRTDEGAIACDKCGCHSTAKSDSQAEAFGWLVDRKATPPKHFCPACREAAARV